MHLKMFVDIYKCVSWPTIFQSNPKAPFSIATTPRCRGRLYSFPSIAPFTLDPYLIMLTVKQRGIKYHFLSFGGISPLSPTLLIHTTLSWNFHSLNCSFLSIISIEFEFDKVPLILYMFVCVYIYLYCYLLTDCFLAQSAGAVEYTDCTSAEG